MSGDLLQQIQTLQFTDKAQAEQLLIGFIREAFNLDVFTVELRPLAVSLNSFNGFMNLGDGQRFFFKTHTEPDNVIGEYYNAGRLAQAGYPVIQPVFSSTEAGKQILIYEVINDPSVFDVAWEIENGNDTYFAGLTDAQNRADDQLFQLYLSTLEKQDAKAASQSPIHQLFYHRLVGGRLNRFYGSLPGQEVDDRQIMLPSGQYSMQQVRKAQWRINGQQYGQSLDDLITQAINLLNPEQAAMSVIGHGDAHNGNVFFQHHNRPETLLYFDPAFAGRHDPLLDLVKPLFHNVFAMWMYFPQEKTAKTEIDLKIDGDLWAVEHDYALHPVRLMFWRSKIERTLIPVLKELKRLDQLRPDWRVYLKAGLFCCPFLTMNLTDPAKFTPAISLLGLTMAVETGAESSGKRSLLDQTMDEIEQIIA